MDLEKNYHAYNGSKLEYAESENGTYTRIYGLKTIPDIGGEPNTIDTTMGKFARKKRSALSLQNPGAISYSVQMRPNGMNENDPERAYASLQYAGTVKLEQLASHISEHGCYRG